MASDILHDRALKERANAYAREVVSQMALRRSDDIDLVAVQVDLARAFVVGYAAGIEKAAERRLRR